MNCRLLTIVALLAAFCLSLISCSHETEDLAQCNSFHEAVPVWAEGRETEKNLTLSFREVVSVRKDREAIVRLAASTDYRLTVNGAFVAHGPCVAAHDFYRVDCYKVDLKKGENVIAVEVAGYNEPSYYLLDQPSFLQAEVLVGKKCLASTGKDFKAYELGQRRADVPKFSFQRPFMEEYSIDEDFGDWKNDPEWAGTASVNLVRQPEKTLIVRRVAYPDYRLHDAEKISENVYKFKTNSSGFLRLKLRASDSTRIRVVFDELLKEDGHVNDRRMGFESCMIYNLDAGEYSLESFEPYTMQYAEIRTESGSCEVEGVSMRDYCNSQVSRAIFESSSEDLNKIFEAARETLRQNSLDIFMDCPSRERAGWLCDSYFTSRVAFDFSGDTRIEDNFLENFILPERFKDIDEGMLPMCYPSDHWNHNYIPNWAMWFVLELEEYLGRSGNRAFVDSARDRVYALVDYFKRYLNEDGLLEKLDKWVFVEWSPANSFVQDVNYPTNMLYAAMLRSAGNLYGDQALQEQSEKVMEAIRKQSYDGTFFRDNAVRKDGILIPAGNRTEVCQYYAFFLGTATPELYPELWSKLKDDFGPVRHTDNPYPDVHFANAFIGNYLRLEILSREGLVKQLLNESIAEYKKMEEITGTLWENMTPTASCNHGFASHLAHVFFRDVLGVYKVDPVAKKVTLRLTDCGLEHCKGSIPLGNGSIDLEWTNQDGKFEHTISVPKGYTVEKL